jgi:hypothetical protein
MGGPRIAAIALSGALVVGGAGVAIAAVSKDDDTKAEQAVLDDAAKRLNVSSAKLHDALAAAQDAGLDRAVKDGLLTQKQADAIKARRKASGSVLGGPGGGPRFRGGPDFPGGPGLRGRPGGPGGPGPGPHLRLSLFDDLAVALGTTQAKLFEQLRAGTSVADVAKANGKSLADVHAAVKSAVKTRADKAVADGDLTQKQADAVVARVEQRLQRIESGKPLRARMQRHLRGELPPAPRLRPGGLLPGDGEPDLAPPGGIFS